jgi:NO-binding membrane sensor protein with MHYT domain/DNA-binding LytR/AlgR family response regulator
MHFVAMLAARLPLPVDYLVFPTLLSFLVCVLVVGAAVFAVSTGPLTSARMTAAAVFLGLGIATMHYIGMSALHASAHLHHAPAYVAASVAIAIATSGLSLWLASGGGPRPPLLLSATAFGLAIAGMHYTAMAGLTVFPHTSPASGAPVLSTDLLAIVVAIVAFLMSGVFLLLLVPDRSLQGSTLGIVPAQPEPLPAAAAALAAGPSDALSPTTAPAGSHDRALPRHLARHLPIERDGATHFIAVDDIVAVHANAHYTYVFDGTAKSFCPLAISDVAARLDERRFVRVHRSHIVNIDRVVGLKRAGDNGVIELTGGDRYTVPVSRSRLGGIRSRLQLRTGEAVG